MVEKTASPTWWPGVFEPYRSHVAKRRVFNANDPLQQGIYCEVESQGETGVSASALVAIEEPA